METRRYLSVDANTRKEGDTYTKRDHVKFADCENVRHTFEVVDGCLVIYREPRNADVLVVPRATASYAIGEWFSIEVKTYKVEKTE